MKQFKALLKKEWRTHWTTLLMPVWFTGGVYLITLVGLIIGLIQSKGTPFTSFSSEIPAGMANLILWTSTAGATMLLGTVGIIAAINLADSMLNGGFKRKCEILHLSQPVKISKIVFAKYLLITAGTIALLLVLSLVNSLVISSVLCYYGNARMYFGLSGWAQGLVDICLSLLFTGSMYWFFAGCFKRKSFIMGTLSILAIQVTISILNYTAGLHIPSLLEYLGRMASVNIGTTRMVPTTDMSSLSTMIDSKWLSMVNWDNAMKIIYSVIFYFGGFFLYKRRELS